jgi:hypothetical protein
VGEYAAAADRMATGWRSSFRFLFTGKWLLHQASGANGGANVTMFRSDRGETGSFQGQKTVSRHKSKSVVCLNLSGAAKPCE